ncbi:FliM/FliN family flagellar motor C-terminal domain-containing protein [Shimia thalassica]|uniref:FliM/FliN family flagellar motor C-terminal domain-containing protein n=1 Tax=Shimia thalassica TaxID=1715693 RepID=UPI0026E16524|nr:FliM/FliN family flagellar motor C-terminal domain-containing protein [Shimia thalassica]MDO6479795.1 FliM/FliN family flagellar motor C-terminal domain-containing protein [Shimia thalassica]
MSHETPNLFSTVPIEVTVSVGKARPSIGDLLDLKTNAVLNLDRKVDDPVELYIGERLIAKGQLEELDGTNEGQLAVRLTEISNLPNGIE